MTVNEMIALLQRYPGELPVTVVGTDEYLTEFPLNDEKPITHEGGGAAPEYVALNVDLPDHLRV